MLWQCLWKLSCLNYTIASGSQAVRITQMRCTYTNFLIRQSSLRLIEKKKNVSDSEQSCVSPPAKQAFRDYGSMPVSPIEAHIYLICLRGMKLNHYLHASINHFILQTSFWNNIYQKILYSKEFTVIMSLIQ